MSICQRHSSWRCSQSFAENGCRNLSSATANSPTCVGFIPSKGGLLLQLSFLLLNKVPILFLFCLGILLNKITRQKRKTGLLEQLSALAPERRGKGENTELPLDCVRVHTKPHLPEEGEGCKSSYQDRHLLSIHIQVPMQEEKGLRVSNNRSTLRLKSDGKKENAQQKKRSRKGTVSQTRFMCPLHHKSGEELGDVE